MTKHGSIDWYMSNMTDTSQLKHMRRTDESTLSFQHMTNLVLIVPIIRKCNRKRSLYAKKMRCVITSNVGFRFKTDHVNDAWCCFSKKKNYLRIVYVFVLNFLTNRLPYKYQNAISKAWIFCLRKKKRCTCTQQPFLPCPVQCPLDKIVSDNAV